MYAGCFLLCCKKKIIIVHTEILYFILKHEFVLEVDGGVVLCLRLRAGQKAANAQQKYFLPQCFCLLAKLS